MQNPVQTFDPPLRFSARTMRGAGRGRGLDVPTINMQVGDAPRGFKYGVYACRVTVAGQTHGGALHFGPRLVFKDSVSLEVHILDAEIENVPMTVGLEILARLRDVQNFPDPSALKQAIASDITATRAILQG